MRQIVLHIRNMSLEKHTFEIIVTGDYNLSKIRELARQGIVSRSPHLGLQDALRGDTAWAILAPEVRELLYDFNIGKIDTYHYPHLSVSDTGVVSVIKGADPESVSYCQDNIIKHHLRTYKDAYPSTDMMLWSGFLVQEDKSEFVKKIIEKLGEYLSDNHLFYRRLDSQNKLAKLKKGQNVSWSEVKQAGVCPIRSHGWLLPNIMNVFMMGVWDAYDKQTDEVHHISGADMANYVSKMQDDLSRMYSIVKPYFDLPDKLRFVLHKGSSLRFISLYAHRSKMDELVESMQHFRDFLSYKKSILSNMARAGALPSEIGAEAANLQEKFGKRYYRSLQEIVREHINLGREGFFADITRIVRKNEYEMQLFAVTHEEMLKRTGEPMHKIIYAHDIMYNSSLQDLDVLVSEIYKIKKSIKM